MWLNEVKNPKKEKIVKVKPTPKGLIIECFSYSVFLWKNSKDAKELSEVLEEFCNDSELSLELFVQPNNKTKSGFTLEVGKNDLWFSVDGYWTSLTDTTEQYIALRDKINTYRTTQTHSLKESVENSRKSSANRSKQEPDSGV